MKMQDPNWEKLLMENFDFSSKSLKNVMGASIQWMKSWMHDDTVTNTPLHRKKGNHDEHK